MPFLPPNQQRQSTEGITERQTSVNLFSPPGCSKQASGLYVLLLLLILTTSQTNYLNV